MTGVQTCALPIFQHQRHDAAHKLVVLAMLAFGARVDHRQVAVGPGLIDYLLPRIERSSAAAEAWRRMRERAAKISDEALRRSFLDGVPENGAASRNLN